MAAGALIGALAGPVLGAAQQVFGIGEKRQDKRQIEQQKKLNEITNQQSKFNQGLQLDTWEKTGYGAQKDQMERAGINPALMYGMGGGGGQSMGASAAGGAQASSGAANQAASAGMGMSMAQMGMMASQKANIDADTEKKKIEAAKMAGADTEKVMADTSLTKTTNDLKVIEKNVAEATYQEAVERIWADSSRAVAEAGSASIDKEVAQRTEAERIEQIKTNLRGTVQAVENAKKQGKLIEAETAIKGFEAELTKQGIPAGSPYYVKIVANLLKMVGLSMGN